MFARKTRATSLLPLLERAPAAIGIPRLEARRTIGVGRAVLHADLRYLEKVRKKTMSEANWNQSQPDQTACFKDTDM